MKNIFKEYHITDKENYDQLLKNAIVILDTNTLLNLYRFNSDNKDKFFEILDKVKDRLYMTYQIGNEFYNNRETVITDTYSFRDDLKKYITDSMKKFYNDIENINLGKGARTLLKYEEDLKKDLLKLIKTSEENLTEKLNTFQPNITKDYLKEDNILNRLTNLYNGRVGESLSDADRNKIYKDGAIRYKDKIPPGYEDGKTKQGNNKYGDLVIWNEMINYSKEEKKDILFVSNDFKDDWMQRIKGKTIGPRKELLQEFKKETEGQLFYAISGSNFIEKMSELHDIKDVEELEAENNKINSVPKIVKAKTIEDYWAIENAIGSIKQNIIKLESEAISMQQYDIDTSDIEDEIYRLEEMKDALLWELDDLEYLKFEYDAMLEAMEDQYEEQRRNSEMLNEIYAENNI